MFDDNPWYGKVEVDFREVFFVGSWDDTKSRENPANSRPFGNPATIQLLKDCKMELRNIGNILSLY